MKLSRLFFVIFRKEFKETFSNPQIIIPSLILPFILLIILPVLFLISYIIQLSTIEVEQLKLNFSYMLGNVFPVYFLIVSLTLSSIFSSSSFVVEKEGQTIETIFYTPITIHELFISKILSIFSMVMFIILVFFIFFIFIIYFFSFKIHGKFLFPNFLNWILIVFWLIPSFVFLIVSFIVWISSRSKSFIAAQQISGILIFPIIFLFTYLNKFDKPIFLFLTGLIVFFISFVFIKFQYSKWKYEKFLK